MANIIKRIEKHGARALVPGEVVVGALCVTPRGTLGRAAVGGVSASLGNVGRAGTARRSHDSGVGLAAAFDSSVRWLAITDRRLLAFSGQFKPKALVFERVLDDVDRIEVTSRLQRLLTIVFDDGSVARTEAFRTGNDYPGFERAAVAAGKLVAET